MNRFLIGAAIGAALVYFLDVERGAARRERASNWISQYVNADTMDQARQATRATAQRAQTVKGQITEQVNQLRASRRASANGPTINAAAVADAASTNAKPSPSLKS
ncbi:MAG TPA: YtxH domain-containing protein [Ktedonobacterales bacterium]